MTLCIAPEQRYRAQSLLGTPRIGAVLDSTHMSQVAIDTVPGHGECPEWRGRWGVLTFSNPLDGERFRFAERSKTIPISILANLVNGPFSRHPHEKRSINVEEVSPRAGHPRIQGQVLRPLIYSPSRFDPIFVSHWRASFLADFAPTTIQVLAALIRDRDPVRAPSSHARAIARSRTFHYH